MKGIEFLNNLSSTDAKCFECLDYTINMLTTRILTDVGIKGVDLIDKGFRLQILPLVNAGYLSETMIEQHTPTVRAGIYYAPTDKAIASYHLRHNPSQN